jgi:hypothetical protein
MAIQEYVQSIAADRSVSKGELFRYLELQFARVDRDHDGRLNTEELAAFAHAIYFPDADQREPLKPR